MPNVIMADYRNNEIYDQEFKRRKAYKLGLFISCH